jgi:putative transposase
VEAYRKDYPISVLCNTLGVSLSGYYAWKKCPVSQHQLEDSQLAEHIHVAYQASRQVYRGACGSPRIHAELCDQGIICSRRRVARLMRERGLSACRLRHRKITTHSVPGARVAPNRLKQEFTATRRLGEVGGRHNSHLDVRRVVIPGSSARSLLASGDWMGPGCNPGRSAH